VATLLNGNVIVGFSPAASAGKPAGTGAPAGDAAASPLGFFGALLDFAEAPSADTGIAAAKGLVDPVVKTATASMRPSFNVPAVPAPVPPAVGFTASVDAAMSLDALPVASDVPAPEPDDVMADLVDALAVLGDTLDSGMPPNEAIENKVGDLIDALAGLLGLPVPNAPAVEPEIAAAAAPKAGAGADMALDALAAISAGTTTTPAVGGANAEASPGTILATMAAGAAIDETVAATATTSPVTVGFESNTEISATRTGGAATPSLAALADVAEALPLPEAAKQVLAALGLFTKAEPSAPATPTGTPVAATFAVPAPSTAPVAAPTPAAVDQAASALGAAQTPGNLPAETSVPPQGSATAPTPIAGEVAADVPDLVAKLADKLTQLADALEPRSPQLAERLDSLAAKLKSGEIDVSTLEKLGITLTAKAPETEVELAIARLLAPAAEAKQVAAPKPFVEAQLAVPAGIVLPAKDKPAEPLDSTPAQRSSAKADHDTGVEARPEAKSDPFVADTKPAPERRSFAAAFQVNAGVPAEQPAPQPQQAQASVLTTPTTLVVAAEARAMHAAYRQPVQQINVPQVAFEIVRQAQAGNSRFQIRLDPPELGRIDVKLDVDKSGNVNARLTVERAETLDLMQRDQRSLERALAQAGLDSSKTNLEFSLRQNPFGRDEQQFQQQQGGNGRFGGYAPQGEPAEEPSPLPQIVAYRGLASAGGVNLFV
jgi:flagellar hook-length control protein FliK